MNKIIVGLIFLINFQAWGMDYQIEKVTNQRGHALNVVYMLGVIDNSEALRWMSVERELDSSLDTLFILNSPGGNVPIGLFTTKKVEEFIAKQSANQRQTWVAIDGQCSSMCVPLFFTWPHRFAVANTKIGLHGVSDASFGFDSELTQMYLDNMLNRAAARGETSASNWIQRMRAQGEFWSNQITAHPAQEVAEDRGLLSPEGIVEGIGQLIEQL